MFGSAEDRALLHRAVAEPALVPEALRLRTRRAVEQRLFFSRRARGPLLLLALALFAGAALAYQLAGRRRVASQTAMVRERRHAIVEPLAAPAAPAPRKRRSIRPRLASRAPGEAGVQFPSWVSAGEEEGDEALPAPESPRLLIARAGQPEVAVSLAADRVLGRIRGAPVDLTLGPAQIVGKLGQRNVWLWVRGHRAEGEIGGLPVRFELVETSEGHQLRQGFSVRGSLPYGAVRIETTAASLSWLPCRSPLAAAAEGVYQGRCASGNEARVTIPPSWRRLPVLPRLILLSFFLGERDPALGPLFEGGG